LIMRAIKCLKGVRWMPWHAQAMKDVVRCDKLRGAANELRSGDFRMGKPIFSDQLSVISDQRHGRPSWAPWPLIAGYR
jgi:hypothetical protein